MKKGGKGETSDQKYFLPPLLLEFGRSGDEHEVSCTQVLPNSVAARPHSPVFADSASYEHVLCLQELADAISNSLWQQSDFVLFRFRSEAAPVL